MAGKKSRKRSAKPVGRSTTGRSTTKTSTATKTARPAKKPAAKAVDDKSSAKMVGNKSAAKIVDNESPAKMVAKTVGEESTTRKSAKSAARKPSVKKAVAKSAASPSAAKSAAKEHVATGRFEAEGPVVWAVLAPMTATALEDHVVREDRRTRYLDLDDDDEPRTWCVVAGGKQHAALVETMLGSDCGDRDVAKALSKQLGKPVYSVGFSGYDDPDHGLPYIVRYDDGKEGLIWMAPSYDDELGEPETVAGPKGVPCKDPFEFAKALGCDLAAYWR